MLFYIFTAKYKEMLMNIIGRKTEINELNRIMESTSSEFVMVYGRRRVGKTFLIREYFANRFSFYVTGIAQGTLQEQLMNLSSLCRQPILLLPILISGIGLKHSKHCPGIWRNPKNVKR